MPTALPIYSRRSAWPGQAGWHRRQGRTSSPQPCRQRYASRSAGHAQPQVPQLACLQQHHIHHQPRVCCSAAATAGGSAASSDQHSGLDARSSSIVARFWDWWSLGPTEEGSSKNTQSLRGIAGKLWRLLRVNRWLLLGAFTFMVRRSAAEDDQCCPCEHVLDLGCCR